MEPLSMVYGVAFALFGGIYMLSRFLMPAPATPSAEASSSSSSTSGGSSRKRAMSFNSACMMKSFPAAAEVQPPIINILLLMRKCPSEEKLAETFSELLIYDRFRSTVISTAGGAFEFQECIHVDLLNKHIITVHASSEQELLQKVDEIDGKDLEGFYGDRPLWCVVRLVNTSGKGCSGLLVRIHHVIGDGISLVGTMSKLFKDEHGGGGALQINIPEKMSGGSASSPRHLDSPTRKPFDASSPSSAPAPSRPGFLSLVGSFFAVLGLALSPFDSELLFSTHRGDRTKLKMTRRRKTIVFPTVKLDFVKNIKNAANVTVNDVMMACTAGAIRRYCIAHGDVAFADATRTLRARALLPVAFPRPAAEMASPSLAMRNQWAFASVALPISQPTHVERLVACNASTTALKNSPVVGVQMWVQSNLLPLLPSFMQQKTAFDVFARHTMVFSNLPGPSETVTIAGERMVGIQVMFPNLLPQVLLMSYGGSIFFNMSVDDELLLDCDDLAKLYQEELVALAEAYKVSNKNMLSDASGGGVFGVIDNAFA